MNNQYPKMLYKAGGPHEIHGGQFDYIIVDGEDAEREALASGWHLSTDAAREPVKEAPAVDVEDDAPPTRAELETKARELKITFDGRTTDAKLAAKIAAALKG